MRIGLLGGTFDPVHLGHLLLAEACREQGRLDEVWFIPAAVPPHKQDQTLSKPADRIEMLKLAIGGYESFRLSEMELNRGGVSYTVDTLETLQRERPGDELFLLMGGDSLHDLPTWRDPRRICELALPMTVGRPGAAEPDWQAIATFVSADRLALIRSHHVEMPQVGISSRDLRRRVAEGRSIRFQVPRAVEMYIATAGLYRPSGQ